MRAPKLNVELLESRDVASAVAGGTPGYVAEYHEGYEYGDGTGIGWATGGYTVVTDAGTTPPAPEAPGVVAEPVAVVAEAAEGVKSAVYLNGELVAEVKGEPALAFFAPPLGGATPSPAAETIVYVNGQPVGTVTGTPAVAVVGPAAKNPGDEPELTLSYLITAKTEVGPELPDEENFDLTLLAWVG